MAVRKERVPSPRDEQKTNLADGVEADAADLEYALDYLSHYGYLSGSVQSAATDPVMAVVELTGAITEFQSRGDLGPTGKLDEDTIALMRTPRCGLLDFLPQRTEAAQWRKRKLHYYVAEAVPGLSRDDQIALIRQAWGGSGGNQYQSWQDYADIELLPATSGQGADIVIATGQGAAQGFDGPGKVLAYAYLPSGDDRQLLMRYDRSEQWDATMFLGVSAHEFGHLLGLEHSRVNKALMAPFFNRSVLQPQNNDDVTRIVDLYGRRQTTPPVIPPPSGTRKTITIEIVGDVATASIPGFRVTKLEG